MEVNYCEPTSKKYRVYSRGFLELLLINDPPEGKSPFVVHLTWKYGNEGFIVEFSSIKDAYKIYKKANSLRDKEWKQLPNCTSYNYDKPPWFYSGSTDIPKNIYKFSK